MPKDCLINPFPSQLTLRLAHLEGYGIEKKKILLRSNSGPTLFWNYETL